MVRLWDTRNHFIHDQEAKQEKERGKCPGCLPGMGRLLNSEEGLEAFQPPSNSTKSVAKHSTQECFQRHLIASHIQPFVSGDIATDGSVGETSASLWTYSSGLRRN